MLLGGDRNEEEAVGISSPFSYTGKTVPTCSPSGTYVAYVVGTRLCVRATRSMALKRMSELGDKFARMAHILKWDTSSFAQANPEEERLLIAGGHEVRTFIVGRSMVNKTKKNQQTQQDGTILTIDAISNALWLTGTIPTPDVNEEPECVVRIIVFGRDGVTGAQVWSGDGVELNVPSPKSSRLAGVFTRDHETFFSLVCRPYTHDLLETFSLRKQSQNKGRHSQQSEALASVSFEGTVLDSKVVKYSPSGRFVAVLDSPAVGYSVHLYSSSFGTSDKHIHSYYGPHYLKRPSHVNIIPATSIEWLRLPNTELLLVADQSQTVSVLSPLTFKPLATFNHLRGYVYRDLPVWSEFVSSPSGMLIYSLASLPYSPVTTSTKHVIHLCPSSTGGYVSTVVASMPSTVWIWKVDPDSELFSDLICVVSHSSPIKSLEFREGPKSSSHLLITLSVCNFVGIWDSSDQQHPTIFQFSDLASTASFTANWITLHTKKQGYDICGHDGRSFVVKSPLVEHDPDRSYLMDPEDDTNVLQIAAEVELRDLDSLSDAEDTFFHSK